MLSGMAPFGLWLQSYSVVAFHRLKGGNSYQTIGHQGNKQVYVQQLVARVCDQVADRENGGKAGGDCAGGE